MLHNSYVGTGHGVDPGSSDLIKFLFEVVVYSSVASLWALLLCSMVVVTFDVASFAQTPLVIHLIFLGWLIFADHEYHTSDVRGMPGHRRRLR